MSSLYDIITSMPQTSKCVLVHSWNRLYIHSCNLWSKQQYLAISERTKHHMVGSFSKIRSLDLYPRESRLDFLRVLSCSVQAGVGLQYWTREALAWGPGSVAVSGWEDRRADGRVHCCQSHRNQAISDKWLGNCWNILKIVKLIMCMFIWTEQQCSQYGSR